MKTSVSEENPMNGERRKRRPGGGRLGRRLGVAAGAALVAGALPAGAGATDYCVAPNTGCGGNNVATFEQALDQADNANDGDRVFLGAGTYTAPVASGFYYSASNAPVEIIGQGRGQTIVTSPAAASYVVRLYGGSGTSVRDLTIRIPQNAAAGHKGLWTDDSARRIEVIEAQAQAAYRTGVEISDGGTLEDSTVTLGTAHQTTGAHLGNGGATVRRSVLSARIGVSSGYGGTIEGSRVVGTHTGFQAYRGVTTIANSLIRFSEGGGGTGIYAGNQPGYSTSVNADGVTVAGPNLPATFGAAASTFLGPAQNAGISLTNSIIRGVSTPLRAATPPAGGGKATVSASYSDYSPSGDETIGPNGSIIQANISNLGNAGFVDAAGGDYHLLPGSPLVDKGDPATAQGLDLDGNPLVADGDGDGSARRDLGAFELPAGPPAGPLGGQAPTGGRIADTQSPLISGFRAAPSRFAVARARTPLAARLARGTRFRYSLSEPARVTIKIQRALAGRRAGDKCVRPTLKLRRAGRCTLYQTVGTLSRTAKSGANSTRFSGRIGKRALQAGRYRAVIRATDAAGNRSARHMARFRVPSR
jgi:hypothetical protein